MVQISDASVQQMLSGRYIASLATENADGSLHMVAVWYYSDGENIYVATAGSSRKAQNARRSSKASLMIDSRDPAAQRGICIAGTAQLLTGAVSSEWNAKVHQKYLSTAALTDPRVGPVFAQWDDVAIQIVPSSVIAWDMREIDRQAFGGAFHDNPGYFLPVED
jgi:general stress protein 26